MQKVRGGLEDAEGGQKACSQPAHACLKVMRKLHPNEGAVGPGPSLPQATGERIWLFPELKKIIIIRNHYLRLNFTFPISEKDFSHDLYKFKFFSTVITSVS